MWRGYNPSFYRKPLHSHCEEKVRNAAQAHLPLL